MKYGEITFGQAEAVFNKLGGKDGVEAFLRGDLVVKAVEGALRYLKLAAKDIVVKTVVVAKATLFGKKASVKTYLGSNFESWVFPEIPDEIPAFDGKLQKTQLTKNMNDTAIQAELGQPKPHTVVEFIAIIIHLLSKQAKGEEGMLLTNGYANIFYVQLADSRVVAVGVYWDADGRGWCFNADGLGGGTWGGGDVVFSRS